ncbi:ureidoglycolate hydrolase [Spathaspora passalidarum NRRL Y-27907]|uniref:Ureidoglycolate lyase n=1 Tax=Spathaspora passalidarum (strain NRRL Y-27907 / 11-Y1) TaxID=619300 RepID=G3AHA2_SPAPN|nr:ureidoglycolate hydrolase [Spathaspora passalidarum NRRL Y-27907]EGW35533.1 ureidoglycolate hydrolase [Spathaspora passalidarum NRRL Y-27907]
MVLETFDGSKIPPIIAKLLTPENFEPFGGVISPEHQVIANDSNANYGTAIKIPKVAPVVNNYKMSQSGSSTTNWNIFRCSRPDHLLTEGRGNWQYTSTVLERHPFTTQTFLPLGKTDEICYLVIVAKSDTKTTLPDPDTIAAFLCRGNQSVTYGVGVWHAPMITIQDRTVDFAVLVHESGIAEEDTQECYYDPGYQVYYRM